ncbi:MAG TPA: retropepsin-like aspartic protease [Flavobacterium sp.]|jgi:predicted aspartyl protease
MTNLQNLISGGKYKKIRFKITKTNHLLLKASINKVKGNFILDTGASSSCVGIECIELFNLTAAHSDTKAAGAGAVGMQTQISNKNKLKIGAWSNKNFDLVVFDLSHVNAALTEHKSKPVQGIIGADVLIKGKAIIDYNECRLYLL